MANSRNSRGSGQITTHNSDQLLDMLRQEVMSAGSNTSHRNKGAVEDSLDTFRTVEVDVPSDEDREEHYPEISPDQNHQLSGGGFHLHHTPAVYNHRRNVSSGSDRFSISTSQQTARQGRTGPGSVQRVIRQLGSSDDEEDVNARDSLDDEDGDLVEEKNYQQQLKERLKQEEEEMQLDDSLEDEEDSPPNSLDLKLGEKDSVKPSQLTTDTRGSDRYEDLEGDSQSPDKDPYANLRYDPNWKDRGALIVSTPFVEEELKARTRMVDFQEDFFPSDSLDSVERSTLSQRLGTPHPVRDANDSREDSRGSEDSRYTLQTESGNEGISSESLDDGTPVRDEEDDTSEREEIREYQRALKVGQPRVVPYNQPFPSPPQAPYAQQSGLNVHHWPNGQGEEQSVYHSKKDSEHQATQQARPVGPVGYTSPRAVGPVVQKVHQGEITQISDQPGAPNSEYGRPSDVSNTSDVTSKRPTAGKPPLPTPPKTEKPPPKSFIELNKENLSKQDGKKGGSYAKRYAQKKAQVEQPPSARRKKGKGEVSEQTQEDVEDISNMTAEEVWQLKQERLRQAKEAKSGVKSGKKSKPQKVTRVGASPPSKASSAGSNTSHNSQESQESMELRSISQTTTQVDAPSVRKQGAPHFSPHDTGYQSHAVAQFANQSQQGLYPEVGQTSPQAYHPTSTVQPPVYAFPNPQAPINVNINLSFDSNDLSPKQGQAVNRVSPRVSVDAAGRQEDMPPFREKGEYQDFPTSERQRQDDLPLRQKQRSGRQEQAYNSTHGPPEEMGGFVTSAESHRSHPQARQRPPRKESAYTTLSDPTDKSTRQLRRPQTFSKPLEEDLDYHSEPGHGSYAQIHQAERRLVQREQQQRQRSLPGNGVKAHYQGSYTNQQNRPGHGEHSGPQRGTEYEDPFNRGSQEYEEGPYTYTQGHGARGGHDIAQHYGSPRGPHANVHQYHGVQHGPHGGVHGPFQHHGPPDRAHGPPQHHGPPDRTHGPPQHAGPYARIVYQAPDLGPQPQGHPEWQTGPHQAPQPHFPPYMRNVGRRSSEGDIMDLYEQEGLRRQSFSPYSKVPPIGPQEERKVAKNTINHVNKQSLKAKSNSEGYLATYAKSKAAAKKKPTNYKAYTVQDYKNLKKDVRLGGLGPDLDSVQDKADKIRRQKEYANSLREQHAKQKAEWQKKRDAQPYYPQEDGEDFYSKREVQQEMEEEDDAQKRRKRALQYAKSVPKPKPAPPPKAVTVLDTQPPATIPYHPPPESHPPNILKIEREEPTQPAPSPVMSEIQKMKMRHEKDRANAEAIRRNMGSKAQGVVDS